MNIDVPYFTQMVFGYLWPSCSVCIARNFLPRIHSRLAHSDVDAARLASSI